MNIAQEGAKPNDRKLRIAVIACLVLLFGMIHIVKPDFYPTIWHLIRGGQIQDLVEYIRSFGAWAMVISGVLGMLFNVVGVLPVIIIYAANGILFGVVKGTLISWLPGTLGVIIGFVLMRTLFRGMAERLIQNSPSLQRMDQFSGRNGLKIVLLARSVPFFPAGAITAVAAISSIPLGEYALASLIGKFPSTAIEVIMGHDLVSYKENMTRLTVIIVGIIALYGGIWWYKRKAQSKLS